MPPIDIQLLPTRLSIVMVREKLTFLNTISEFQFHLKRYFKIEYNQDEIETALFSMEEAFICVKAEQESNVVEIEEDETN